MGASDLNIAQYVAIHQLDQANNNNSGGNQHHDRPLIQMATDSTRVRFVEQRAHIRATIPASQIEDEYESMGDGRPKITNGPHVGGRFFSFFARLHLDGGKVSFVCRRASGANMHNTEHASSRAIIRRAKNSPCCCHCCSSPDTSAVIDFAPSGANSPARYFIEADDGRVTWRSIFETNPITTS